MEDKPVYRHSGEQVKRRRRKSKPKGTKTEPESTEITKEMLPKVDEEVQEVESPPLAKEEKTYTIGTWRGMKQWKCKLCPWDTLKSEAAMLEHIASAHKPPPKPKILIADKSGRQIN